MSYVPGQIVVEFTDGASMNETLQNQVYNKIALQSNITINVLNESTVHEGLELIEISNYNNLTNIAHLLEDQPEILYADPNYEIDLEKIPDDTYYDKLWGLNNTGANDNGGNAGKAGADINAQKAWDISTGSKNVVVAVIDSGVDITHPDLSGNIWTNPDPNAKDLHGWNFFNNNGDVSDTNGHGTHCAGIIGAVGNNNIGITGVAWKITILPIKDSGKSGVSTEYADAQAVYYATKIGADVICLSLGTSEELDILKEAISKSSAVVICAAGNDGTNNDITPQYPASFALSNTLSIAATNNKDQLASFSNYGKTVDLAAPGEAILSTWPMNLINPNFEPYKFESGTSMATPFVAGVAALIKSVDPILTNVQIKEILLKSVDPLTNLNGKVSTGGRINAYKAAKLAEEIKTAGFAALADLSDPTQGNDNSVTAENLDNSNEQLVYAYSYSESNSKNNTTIPLKDTGMPLNALIFAVTLLSIGVFKSIID